MSTIRTGDDIIPTVIAKEDVVVPDPASSDPAFGRQILAGHPVPADLLEAYAAATGTEDASPQPEKPAVKAVVAPAVDKAVRGPEARK